MFHSGPARGRSSVVLRHQPIVSGSAETIVVFFLLPLNTQSSAGANLSEQHLQNSQSVALSPRTQRVESEKAGKLLPDIYQCLLKP